MRASRLLAVDVGAAHVACGLFAVTKGRLVLQQFALETHTCDPSLEGSWAAGVAASLGAVTTRRTFSGPAVIAVPGHLAWTKFVRTPSVPPEKRSRIVSFEAAENIPYPLGEVVWDHAVVADDGADLELILAAAKLDAMHSLCAAAAVAGLSVERATPAALALGRTFRHCYPEQRDCVIVASIGARSTSLLFLEGDRDFVRTLPLGGNAVTQAIADELRIDFTSAETLKVQVLSGQSELPAASPARAAVQRAAGGFATRLQLEITRSVVHRRRQPGGAAAVAIYLTGGGSLLDGLPATLAEKFNVPVERCDPLRNIDLSADARAAGAETSAAMLADLVGLATRLVQRDGPDACLLPPALTAARAFRRRQPFLMAAAVLGVVALAPPVYYLHRVTAATLERIAQVDRELVPRRAIAHRNQENLHQIDDAMKQIAALRGAYETQSTWINFLAELQEGLVRIEDVWLDRLRVVRPPLPGPGEMTAGDPAQAGAAVPSAGATESGTKGPPLRLMLSGRLLDIRNPQSKVSADSTLRVKQLLASFTRSPFIAAVENERFDPSQDGLLRFDFTLVISPLTTL